MRMGRNSLLFVGLFGVIGAIFTINHTYKYLKKGKIQSIQIFSHTIFSFKKEPHKAYMILAFNSIIALLSLIVGIGFILMYFNIIEPSTGMP